MPWQVPVVLRIIMAHIVGQYFLKKVVGLPSRTRRFVWQFFFAMIIGLAVAFLSGTPLADKRLFLVGLLAAVNSIGTYCYWRALAISQSKTALMTWADDVIAMLLAYVFLGEMRVLTSFMILGIVLCMFATVALPVVSSSGNAGGKVEARAHRVLIGWVAGYSIFWGITSFAMRAFALRNVPLVGFIASWYVGAFVGALAVQAKAGPEESGGALDKRGIGGTVVLAVLIMIALICAYWQRQLAPITVVQPIQQVTEMVFPALMGLFVFKEAKGMTRSEKARIALGMAGGIIVALSF